jgi:serine protease AprX
MSIVQRSLAILSVVVLCLMGLASPPLSASTPTGSTLVRLSATDYDLALALAAPVLNYGSFVMLDLAGADFARLRATGLSYQLYDQPFTLRLGEQSFDPLVGLPHLPAGWDKVAADGPDLHLVQFAGPTKAEWLDRLRKDGLEIVQYIHPFTYVVWGDPAALDKSKAASSVRWTGDFYPAFRVLPKWRTLPDEPVQVSVLLYRGADTDTALHRIEALGGQANGRGVLNDIFEIAGFTISGARLQAAAQVPGVYSIQRAPAGGGLRGEMSDQINVNNHDASNLAFPGYQAWLSGVGLSGSGVIIANVDSGVDNNHADLVNRFVACSGTTCGGDASSSHGTHTAGIMAADGTSGATDSYGFLRGLGMAPGANLVEQIYDPTYSYPNGMLMLMTDSYNNGASLSGNSWGPSGTPQGYDADTMQVDIGVRDADPNTPGNQPLNYILSFMNGNGGYQTQGTPDEAKNILTIGSTKMQTSGGAQILQIDDLSPNTAHGPALDGRTIPHLVAPGCSVDSTVPGGHGLMCGTSMASPHVSGAVALFIEYYRNLFGVDPSPALVKAAFLPVAHDLVGHLDADGRSLGHPFDYKQGWGRLDAQAVVDPDLPVLYFDNPAILDNTGEEWVETLLAADAGQPLRLMLVWTDAPGHGLGGTTPAWNNDLDLVVEAGGNTYRGNNFGPDGWSQPGGVADGKNNTEGLFLGPTASGSLTIHVVASNINSDGIPNQGDATDQDFSLVCYNCISRADFALSVQPDTFKVCSPHLVTGTIQVGQILSYPHDVTLAVLDVPADVTASASPVVVTPPGEAVLSLSVGDVTAGGEYTLTISGKAEVDRVHTVPVHLAVTAGLSDAPLLVSPADGALGLPARDLALTWEPLPQVEGYHLQVDTDPGFVSPLVDVADIPDSAYTLTFALEPATCYFWRTAGENGCGPGPWASPFRFTSGVLDTALAGDVETGAGNWRPVQVGPGAFADETAQIWWRIGSDYFNGDTGWSIHDVQIGASMLLLPAPLVLAISPGSGSPGSETPVTISGQSFQPAPVVMLGSTPLLSVTYASSTTLAAVVPAGLAPGIYDLMVVNRDCQAGVLAGAYGACDLPQGSFESDSPVALGQPMHFTATITGTGPLTYTWDFGDGVGTGVGNSPVYTYPTPGDFVVSLRVEGPCGSQIVTGTVTVGGALRRLYLPLVWKQRPGS